MKEVEERFNSYFAKWGIVLPPEDVARRRRGEIQERGWTIQYLFGSDDNGEYLDFYSSHRMTNDRHVRLYVNGAEEELPALWDMRLVSEDPEEDRRLGVKHRENNERASKLLKEKGF